MNARLAIAERIPSDAQRKLMPLFKSRINRLSSSLDVSVQLSVTNNSFVSAEIQGSDSEFLIALIRREMQLAPRDLSEIEINDNFKAFVSGINKNRQSIEVEIGPVSMKAKCEVTREAFIAQLCDGRDVPLDRVAQSYCLEEGVPILVRITSVDPGRRQIEAWVSDDQIARFEQWRRQRFHRIIAVGGSQEELREAIRLSRIERDIIQIEGLSFTASSLVCQFGTEAPGIIAKIGRYISNFKLHAFIPARVDKLRTEFAAKQ